MDTTSNWLEHVTASHKRIVRSQPHDAWWWKPSAMGFVMERNGYEYPMRVETALECLARIVAEIVERTSASKRLPIVGVVCERRVRLHWPGDVPNRYYREVVMGIVWRELGGGLAVDIERVAQCIAHDDCEAHRELGEECWWARVEARGGIPGFLRVPRAP